MEIKITNYMISFDLNEMVVYAKMIMIIKLNLKLSNPRYNNLHEAIMFQTTLIWSKV